MEEVNKKNKKCRFDQSMKLGYIAAFGVWRSLVARLLWEQDVGGSNPLTPTSFGAGIAGTDREHTRQ